MKVAPILLALATLAFAFGVKSCDPLSQAQRAALRAPKVEKPRPKKVVQPAPAPCTENCQRTSDDQMVVVSPVPGGVPMGGGVYLSVR